VVAVSFSRKSLLDVLHNMAILMMPDNIMFIIDLGIFIQ
jgi:hypothetical protein